MKKDAVLQPPLVLLRRVEFSFLMSANLNTYDLRGATSRDTSRCQLIPGGHGVSTYRRISEWTKLSNTLKIAFYVIPSRDVLHKTHPSLQKCELQFVVQVLTHTGIGWREGQIFLSEFLTCFEFGTSHDA